MHMNKNTLIGTGLIFTALLALGLTLRSEQATAPTTATDLIPTTTASTTDTPPATTSVTSKPTPITAPQPTSPTPTTPTGSMPEHSPFGAPFTLNVGSRMVLSDSLIITLNRIDDSRCKPDVQCIWAGELSPTFTLANGSLYDATKTITLGTSRTPTIDVVNYRITLGSTTPTNVTLTISTTGTAPAKIVGTVTGTVGYRSLCPPETSAQPCEIPREMYAEKNVVAYLPDGVTIAGRVMLNPNGMYSLPLTPGSYLIQMQSGNVGTGEKKPVTIIKDQTVTLDFDLDATPR